VDISAQGHLQRERRSKLEVLLVTPRFLISGDMHFDQWRSQCREIGPNLLTPRAEDISRAVQQQHKYMLDNGIIHYLFLGDMFHKRDLVEVPVFNHTKRLFQAMRDDGIEVYLLPGNHDYTTKGLTVHSLESFNDIATVISGPTVITVNGVRCYFLPYMECGDISEAIKGLLDSDKDKGILPSLLLGHLGIHEAVYGGSEIRSREPVALSDLSLTSFTGAFFGHYHPHQQVSKNAYYVGAPVQHTFKDRDNVRGFLDVELFTKDGVSGVKVTQILTENVPQFHYLTPKDYEATKGTLPSGDMVRLVGATRKQQLRYAEDEAIHGVNQAEVDTESVRLAIGLGEAWESIIDKYVAFQLDALDTKGITDSKVLSAFGKDLMTKVSTVRTRAVGTSLMDFRMTARNYMAFGDDPVSVDFSTTGLTLIAGRNTTSRSRTSNGAGKSTILSALLFCLYGKPSGILKKELPNHKTKKNVEVTVELTDVSGREATICRRVCMPTDSPYQDGLYFEVDGDDMRGATDRDTQVRVEAFLGLEKAAFAMSVLFSAGDSKSFAGETPGVQDEVFTQLLKMGNLSDAEDLARKSLKASIEAIAEAESRILVTKGRISEQESFRVKAEASIADWEATQNQHIKAWIQKVAEYDVLIPEAHEQIEDAEGALDDLLWEQDERLKALKNFNVENTLKVQEEYRERKTQLDKKMGELLGSVKAVDAVLRSLRNLHGTAKCPTCLNDIEEEHRLTSIEEQTGKRAQLESVYQTLDGEMGELTTRLTSVSNTLSRANLLISTMKAGELEEVRLKSRVEAEYVSVGKLKDEQDRAKLNVKTLQSQEPPASANLESVLKRIEELSADIEKEQNDIESLHTPRRLVSEFWVEGFGSSGIRNLLIEGVLPELNQIAARYSEILTDGELRVSFKAQKSTVSGEKRNKLSVSISDIYGSESYAASSGGERRRIDLVVNLSLHSLVARRYNIGFVIMDEVFIKLDEAGRRAVLELLRELTEEIPSIFIISNQDSVRQEPFDQIWTMVRKGQVSTLEG